MTPDRISDDPVALRSAAMTRFFTGVMRREMRRTFRSVRILRSGLPEGPPGAAQVIYTNHPGWWDPALYIVLQDALFPGNEGYGPMDAAALARYRFMRRIGIFGVEAQSAAGAARFLRVGRHLLSDPRRTIWMTAQGRFADPRERPVALRPGLAHLLRRVPGVVVRPMAIEYPFWSEKRPEALTAFGAPITAPDTVEAWQQALTDGMTRTQDTLAEAAMARDPAPFSTILGGARGTGGVYGAWSRLRDLSAGRRHDPDHQAER